jgi:hypothetical protein
VWAAMSMRSFSPPLCACARADGSNFVGTLVHHIPFHLSFTSREMGEGRGLQ